MSGFWGMDVERGREHASRMEAGAAALRTIGQMLQRAASTAEWTGPDADAFRAQLGGVHARILERSLRCRSESTALRAHAKAQESASAAGGALRQFSTGELLGELLGSRIDAPEGFGTRTTPYDVPGDDIAPIRPEDITHQDDLTVPTSIADMLTNLDHVAREQDDHEATIRIQAIEGPDGETRYVVYVPGSKGSMLNTIGMTDVNGNPFDWNQNPGALLGQSTDSSRAVQAAMEAAGIPYGADVALVGHSQGGIAVSNLAADPSFNGGPDGWNVTDVITVGSPVQWADVPPTTNTINFAHVGEPLAFPFPAPIPPLVSHLPFGIDLTPELDGDFYLHGNAGHRTEVQMQGPSWDLSTNHGVAEYQDSIGASDDPAIAAFEQSDSMSNYLAGEGDVPASSTVDVLVSREEDTYGDESVHPWDIAPWPGWPLLRNPVVGTDPVNDPR
ncbi:hypothetical protein ACT3SP_17275 [Brachybacterium sp. AOP43-C2-M15]|uniref:hypothetical protein n=1 Tax=Brachybacterium sp. AOP43-C2-M15 TaxID=3457661 RepID=UPI004033D170